MIDINLMPLDKRKKDFPLYKIYLMGIYGLLALTLLLWAYNLFMFKYDQYKLTAMQDQLSGMNVWKERYALNERQNADIASRGNIIKGLNANRMIWSDMLSELGSITPYGCWLTTVTQDNEKPSNIVIEGRALKMEHILGFIHNLQQDPQITSVSLGGTKSTKVAGTGEISVIEFSLAVVRAGGVPNAQ